MLVQQTPTFKKQVKKLHVNQKKDLDLAIGDIIRDPNCGDLKKGDLAGVQVYKFKMNNQLTLLAYEWEPDENQIVLLALGSHENFYRDLKN